METVGLQLDIQSGNSAQTVGQLKAEVRNLNSEMLKVKEGSAEYLQLAKRAGEAKEKIKDLREQTQLFTRGGTVAGIAEVGRTIAGGFAAAQGAMALFGSESENVQKSLLKVQGAIAIVEGIKAAIQGWETVQRLLNIAMNQNPILLLITAIAAASAAIYEFTKYLSDDTEELKQQGEELIKVNEKLKQYEENTRNIEDATIDLVNQLKVSRGEMSEIEAKFDTIDKKRLKDAQKAYEDYQKAKEEINKNEKLNEENKQKELLKAEQDYNDRLVILRHNADVQKTLASDAEFKKESEKQIEQNKKKQDEYKRYREELEKNEKATNDFLIDIENDRRKHDEETRQENLKAWETYQAVLRKIAQDAAKQQKAEDEFNDAISEQRRADDLAASKAQANAKISLEQSTFQSLNALAIIFTNNASKLQDVQKKIALVQIAVDTAKAISAAVAAASQDPKNVVGGPIALAANVAAQVGIILANIAKAKQMLSHAGSAGSISLPSSGGGGGATPPPINNNNIGVASYGTNQNGDLNGTKSTQLVKAYVVESEMTSSQSNIKAITNKAKIH